MTLTNVVIFNGIDGITYGADPIAQPILTPDGNLIGTTSQSGRCTHCGTIWEHKP